jgi:hypothetical protein
VYIFYESCVTDIFFQAEEIIQEEGSEVDLQEAELAVVAVADFHLEAELVVVVAEAEVVVEEAFHLEAELAVVAVEAEVELVAEPVEAKPELEPVEEPRSRLLRIVCLDSTLPKARKICW